MSSILTNNSSMIALQTLKATNTNLGKIQEQISTGKKVGSARDNSAVFAISTVMKSDVAGFNAISDSLSLGSSTVAVARNGAEKITGLLQEIKGKIVGAQEDNVDRSKIQDDVSALRDQINSIVGAAQFNGLNFLKGSGSVDVLASLDRSADGTVTASNITIDKHDLGTAQRAFGTEAGNVTTTATAAGITAKSGSPATDGTGTVTFAAAEISEGESFNVTIGGSSFDYIASDGDTLNDVTADLAGQIGSASITGVTVSASSVADPTTTNSVLTLTNTTTAIIAMTATNKSGGTSLDGGLAALGTIDVSTADGAKDALANIEGLLQTAIDSSAAFGSSQKRIDIQGDFVSSLVDSMKSGIGALVDADMESASARLQALQVQQQLGVQALSIANQSPQSILSLFR